MNGGKKEEKGLRGEAALTCWGYNCVVTVRRKGLLMS